MTPTILEDDGPSSLAGHQFTEVYGRNRANRRTTGQRDEGLITRGGVVGYQIPTLRETEISVNRGDTLILGTDGMGGGFMEHLTLSDPPQQMADRILEQHGKTTDDALVMVARYLGEAP